MHTSLELISLSFVLFVIKNSVKINHATERDI